MTMDQLRTGDIFKADRLRNRPVRIYGCGALGSAVALLLAKLGVTLILIDDDVIESHNIPNQLLFGINDIGKHKAVVLARKLEELTGIEHEVQLEKFVSGEIGPEHAFVCVDSMTARRAIASALADSRSLLIEGRMGATDFSSYCIARNRLPDMREYYRSIYSDDEAVVDRAACGSIMSIGATATMLASTMVWQFMDAVMERPFPNTIQGNVRTGSLVCATWNIKNAGRREEDEEEDDESDY